MVSKFQHSSELGRLKFRINYKKESILDQNYIICTYTCNPPVKGISRLPNLLQYVYLKTYKDDLHFIKSIMKGELGQLPTTVFKMCVQSKRYNH